MERQRGLWLFLVPSGLVLLLVLVYPLGYALYLSVTDAYLARDTTSFVGLANYAALLGENRFWSSLTTTATIVGCSVAIQFCVGLAVAFGLYRLLRGARVLSVLIFIPHIVTPVVAALFLKWMFASRWGLLDVLLVSLNIFPPDWLGDPLWAKVTVILADSWQFTPFMMLVLYAGLQAVDPTLVEAAHIDGATNWQLLSRVLLPVLRPLILFVLSIRVMDGFRFFDSIYVLTAGGPGTATETVTMYTYNLAFRVLEVGKASALGVITLMVVASIVALSMHLLYRGDRGSSW